MPELEDSSYQKKVVQETIKPLTSFLEDIQCRSGITPTMKRKKFDPYVRDGHKKTISLHDFLSPLSEQAVEGFSKEVDDETETGEQGDGEVIDGLYLAPNQRYFMGASTDPQLTITSRITDDKVYYYTFPYKKEQNLKKEIAADLFKTGSQTWIESDRSEVDEDLKASIESVLEGNPGSKVSIDDYQYTNIQIKYVGQTKGDLDPWKELESEYNVTVDSNLTNKQTYNVRMTNRELDRFESQLREKPSGERNFKIIRITREEREYMIEAAKMKTPKAEIRKIAPQDQPVWSELMQSNMDAKYGASGFMAGQPVHWKKKSWFIVDFVPFEDKMTVVLLSNNYEDAADYVPIEDIKKRDPMEMGPVDNEIPDAERVDVSQLTKDANKGNPTGFDKKKLAGTPVDKTPKPRELELPTSKEDGITQGQKAIKEEKEIEEQDNPEERKANELAQYIENDADLYKQRFEPIINNLKRKRRAGNYDTDLAVKAFEYLVNDGARKYFNEFNGELFGDKYPNFQSMFPRNLRVKVAESFRDEFETEASLGNYDEENHEIILNTIKFLIENSIGQEALPFTQKEKEILNKFDNVDMGVENKATFSWDSGGKSITLNIIKKPRPNMNDVVYSAEATLDDGAVDKERTKNSKPFKTEEDPAILESFLGELAIDEAMETIDTEGVAEKKKVTPKDVHPEELLMGIEIEKEHTPDQKFARKIAVDHLTEIPDYYSRLTKMEREAKGEKPEDKKEE